jgi:hypothetical protein
MLGHHCTSKFQLADAGSSHRMSVVLTSQQMLRLSLAEDSSRDGSWADQARPMTPCEEHHRIKSEVQEVIAIAAGLAAGRQLLNNSVSPAC